MTTVTNQEEYEAALDKLVELADANPIIDEYLNLQQAVWDYEEDLDDVATAERLASDPELREALSYL